MEAHNLADLYGLGALDWTAITARLRQGVPQAPGTGGPDRHTCWLSTLNEDGSTGNNRRMKEGEMKEEETRPADHPVVINSSTTTTTPIPRSRRRPGRSTAR